MSSGSNPTITQPPDKKACLESEEPRREKACFNVGRSSSRGPCRKGSETPSISPKKPRRSKTPSKITTRTRPGVSRADESSVQEASSSFSLSPPPPRKKPGRKPKFNNSLPELRIKNQDGNELPAIQQPKKRGRKPTCKMPSVGNQELPPSQSKPLLKKRQRKKQTIINSCLNSQGENQNDLPRQNNPLLYIQPSRNHKFHCSCVQVNKEEKASSEKEPHFTPSFKQSEWFRTQPRPGCEAKYKIGDLIFAKVRGYPYWPAQVEGFDCKVYRSPEQRYFVVFFGTEEIASVKETRIDPYPSTLPTHGAPRKRRRGIFESALNYIEERHGGLRGAETRGKTDSSTQTPSPIVPETISLQARELTWPTTPDKNDSSNITNSPSKNVPLELERTQEFHCPSSSNLQNCETSNITSKDSSKSRNISENKHKLLNRSSETNNINLTTNSNLVNNEESRVAAASSTLSEDEEGPDILYSSTEDAECSDAAYRPPPEDLERSGAAYRPPPGDLECSGAAYRSPRYSECSDAAYRPPPGDLESSGAAYRSPRYSECSDAAYRPPPGDLECSDAAYRPPARYSECSDAACRPPTGDLECSGAAYRPPPGDLECSGAAYRPIDAENAAVADTPPPIDAEDSTDRPRPTDAEDAAEGNSNSANTTSTTGNKDLEAGGNDFTNKSACPLM